MTRTGRIFDFAYRLLVPLASFSITFMTPAARADSLVVNKVTYADVHVATVRDGEIIFSIGNSSNEIRKPFSQVSKISLSDEPAFSAAEEAYAAGDYAKATENYDKTFRTTQKTWLKDWVSLRLLDSANKAGRFDTAIKSYIALAEKSPESVRTYALNMPKPDSAYLTDGIKQVNSAIASTKNDATKQTLLSLLAQLNKAKGDLKAASEALTQSTQVNAASPNRQESARANALLKLQAISLALSAKEYDKAITAIEKDAASFTEPADQAEALYCLAEAKAGKAAASKDLDTWKEVAIAYMRVVANCPATASQVPSALLKTAAIHETRLNEKETALHIYEQIATDYKGQPPAQQADREIQRLKSQQGR